MMKREQLFNNTKRVLLTASLVTLISCGGGSGSGSTGSGSNPVPENFDLFGQSGVWRLSGDIDALFNSSITVGSETVQANINASTNQLVVVSIQGSGNQFIFNTCDASAPETIVTDEFADDYVEDLDEDVDLGCNNVVNYTKIDDQNYRIEMTCGSLVSADLLFTQVSTSTDFNFGSLSFTSTQNPDLNTTSGVCGTLGDLQATETYTPQPNGLNLTNDSEDISFLTVVGPYNGNHIAFEIDFAGAIQPGTYAVVDDIATNTNEVEVDIQSLTFGGTADDPDYTFATSGTVTITAVTQFAASGSFDITTFNGDNMVGTFSFDIQ